MKEEERVDVDPTGVALGLLAEISRVHGYAWVEGTVNDRALRLRLLREMSARCLEAAADIEMSLTESMESDAVAVAGVGRILRREKTSSSWRYDGAGDRLRDDLADAVARVVALDVSTGEMDPMKRNIARAAMQEAFAAIPAFSSIKAAGKSRLGLMISDYRVYSRSYCIDIEPEGGAA